MKKMIGSTEVFVDLSTGIIGVDVSTRLGHFVGKNRFSYIPNAERAFNDMKKQSDIERFLTNTHNIFYYSNKSLYKHTLEMSRRREK